MSKKRVYAILFKEFMELKKDKSMIASLMIFPVIVSIILPIIFLVGGRKSVILEGINGVNLFIAHLDSSLIPNNINGGTGVLYALMSYFLLPLFLLIPIIISTVISSSSFVGEKEHKTLEGLLYTPITDKELVLGKVLSAAIPSILLTWISIIMYTIILNSLGYFVFGTFIGLKTSWILMGGIIAPLITLLSIFLVVSISQRVKSTKSAQSVAMILIIPVIGFVISQATGIMIFGSIVELLFAATLFIVDIIVFQLIVTKYNREKSIINI